MDRTDVTFPSGDTTCAAWFYRQDRAGPASLVILGHGLGAIREMGLEAYAERFVQAGFAALVFDYRGFGQSGGEPRQWLDVRRQLADWQAAIDFAHTLDGVDPQRIVLFGTSFGGGHVIRGVALVGPPGSAGLMTAPDAEPGFFGLLPPGAEFDDRVDGRIALHVPLNFPGRAAKHVRCPIMFSVCDKDSVAPAKQTLKYAAQARAARFAATPSGTSRSIRASRSRARSPRLGQLMGWGRDRPHQLAATHQLLGRAQRNPPPHPLSITRSRRRPPRWSVRWSWCPPRPGSGEAGSPRPERGGDR